ncbi:hypothetical protein AKJ64_02075 [candidate division MSBL1 archaeon SCGC-AAA259E17]|uniref:Glyoxylate reductase n=1 Tax=candidate division MSBL1 archaeon SCGC-AAA259E17 TaxID=1698263 RepID=A0A133UFB6_9EURY|nr:hypothetical protein AKJ64_02075 [candidate division MSBL1 archaeon SCGC-AAA259E17]
MGENKGSILITPRSYRNLEGPHWDMLESSPYRIVRSPHTEELMTEEEMIKVVTEKDIRGIIVGLDPITEEVIESASDLEIIAKYGTGLDNIDLEAAEKNGIPVTWTEGANSQSVADLSFGLLLALARWIPTHSWYMRNGRLERRQGTEVWEKTLGIVGMGRIGRAMCKRGRKGFDMDILYYDIERKEGVEKKFNADYVEFDELLEKSDFISIHVPLTPETEGMFSTDEFEKMKDEAMIVNTARGPIVDEDALLKALKDGEIAAAALDTFNEEEQLDTELLQQDNFIGSPHAGASTKESVLRMAKMATREVIRVLDGKEPLKTYK